MVVENLTDATQSVSVKGTHVMTPVCRYASPECQRPTTRNVALDTSFDLAPGEKKTLQSITMGVESDNNTVDSYTIDITSGSMNESLQGLEAGAASVVGREEAGEAPWRVTAQQYEIHATLASSGITAGIQSVNEAK